MNNTSILFVITMSGSRSMIANAKLFLEDLINNSINVQLLIPESCISFFENTTFSYITYNENSRDNFKSLIKSNLQKRRFDLILFSNFYFTHPLDLIDNELISFLGQNKIIKASIDPFLLYLNNVWPFNMDFSSFGNIPYKKINNIPSWVNILHYGQIKTLDPNIYYYNHLPKNLAPINPEDKIKILRSYIRKNDIKKNIFFSFNKTHLLSIKEFFHDYFDLFSFLLSKTLIDIRKDTRIFLVSHENIFTKYMQDIEIIHIPELDYSSYYSLLGAVDLFLTDNSLTDSLFYAGLLGINSIVFFNSIKIKNGFINTNNLNINLSDELINFLSSSNSNLIPFRVMPFGWHEQWNNFDSHYFDGVDFIYHLELFDIDKNKNIISSVLFNEKLIEDLTQKRSEYFIKLNKLPTPSDIIVKIINDNKK